MDLIHTLKGLKNSRKTGVPYAPFLVQFWRFASPVAYPSSLVPSRWLYGLNPMTGVIEGFRWALTGLGRPPDWCFWRPPAWCS